MTRRGVFNDQRRITGSAAIHGRGRLHDHVANTVDSLTRSQQLHGADNVDVLHYRAVARLPGSRDDTHMDHRVGPGTVQNLRYRRVSYVGANEVRCEGRRGGNHVDSNGPINPRLVDESICHFAAEIAGDPRNNGNSAHGGALYLLLIAALNPRTTEEFAVLLLGHSLTALLDHRAHELPLLLHRPPKRAAFASTDDQVIDVVKVYPHSP